MRIALDAGHALGQKAAIDGPASASVNAIGRTFHLLAENPVGFSDRADDVIK
jgi:hypothetical protein